MAAELIQQDEVEQHPHLKCGAVFSLAALSGLLLSRV
jgi:hypothetical protein